MQILIIEEMRLSYKYSDPHDSDERGIIRNRIPQKVPTEPDSERLFEGTVRPDLRRVTSGINRQIFL
jgi:hypothetical protein